MELVAKKDLSFKDGWLVNGNQILNNAVLVSEVNDIVGLRDFNKFLKDNKDRIETVGTTVIYEAPKSNEVSILLPEPKTPAIEKAIKEATDIMEELETKDAHEIAQKCLNNIPELIEFITSDTYVSDGIIVARKFLIDPLTLIEKDLIKTFTEFAELKDLREKVIVK
jgi:hypothetical protein